MIATSAGASSTSPTPCARGATASRPSSPRSPSASRIALPCSVVMGGLRAGNTAPMRAEDKDYIRSAWTRVDAATGQPFDFELLRPRGLHLRHRARLPRRRHRAPPAAEAGAAVHGPHQPGLLRREPRHDLGRGDRRGRRRGGLRSRASSRRHSRRPRRGTRPSAISSPRRSSASAASRR